MAVFRAIWRVVPVVCFRGLIPVRAGVVASPKFVVVRANEAYLGSAVVGKFFRIYPWWVFRVHEMRIFPMRQLEAIVFVQRASTAHCLPVFELAHIDAAIHVGIGFVEHELKICVIDDAVHVVVV